MLTQTTIAGSLLLLLLAGPAPQQNALPDGPVPQQPASQQSIPDAPSRQSTLPTPGSVAPGIGTPAGDPDALQHSGQGPLPGDPGRTLPASPTSATAQSDVNQEPDLPGPGEGAKAFTLNVQANFVEVPFTVKDSKNQLVAGLTWRDIKVYENNLRQKLALWTVDPFPLSVALVIDQSVAFTTMNKINNSLGALQGAFTPYDEVAVFTYNNGTTMRTDFTAAQSPRLAAVLEQSKSTGREALYADTTGPLSQNINLSGGAQQHINPLTNPSHGTSQSSTINVPKETHTLNDAILEAAKATTRAGRERRRIVYVISGGEELGSKAKIKEVIQYCQRNKVAVYATQVHDIPTIKGEGFLDKFHIPFQMRDNVLPVYTIATGGQFDPEYRQGGIERSFAKITEQVRNQYTVGYYSREPFIDGKYRKLNVVVDKPNLSVIAKDGYYPTASDARPAAPPVAQ